MLMKELGTFVSESYEEEDSVENQIINHSFINFNVIKSNLLF